MTFNDGDGRALFIRLISTFVVSTLGWRFFAQESWRSAALFGLAVLFGGAVASCVATWLGARRRHSDP
jgi:hypothetical protein